MNMPGFTAELSYSHSEMRYHQAIEGAENANNVVPQARAGSTGGLEDWNGGWQCWYIWGCFVCCSRSWCWYICRAGAASFNGTTIQ